MTPESIDGLTDEQLIERCATEVMEWTRLEDDSCEPPLESWYSHTLSKSGKTVRKELVIDCNLWNPLTDWNHTMEVVAKINRWPLERLGGWVLHSLREKNQRAICLAALKAVSHFPHD